MHEHQGPALINGSRTKISTLMIPTLYGFTTWYIEGRAHDIGVLDLDHRLITVRNEMHTQQMYTALYDQACLCHVMTRVIANR
jgi:hypothetical protein